MICAACGKTGDSLKRCAACKEARYCDVNCQKMHRKEHRAECKRRSLEINAKEQATSELESLSFFGPADLSEQDSDLWKCPERPECPICMLSMPLQPSACIYMPCCGKIICGGCDLKNKETIYGNVIAHRANSSLEETCAFCRKAAALSPEELLKRIRKRMELNDSNAFFTMAGHFSDGNFVTKDERKGFDYLKRAAELGDINACYMLAEYYSLGKHVAVDKAKEKEYLQLAAMGGNIRARHTLGGVEYDDCNIGSAIRHWQIAAGAGYEDSLENTKKAYNIGLVEKDEFAETLRLYQAAREDMKSEDRDRFSAVGAEIYDEMKQQGE